MFNFCQEKKLASYQCDELAGFAGKIDIIDYTKASLEPFLFNRYARKGLSEAFHS